MMVWKDKCGCYSVKPRQMKTFETSLPFKWAFVGKKWSQLWLNWLYDYMGLAFLPTYLPTYISTEISTYLPS
jgi:hypothetical protein